MSGSFRLTTPNVRGNNVTVTTTTAKSINNTRRKANRTIAIGFAIGVTLAQTFLNVMDSQVNVLEVLHPLSANHEAIGDLPSQMNTALETTTAGSVNNTVKDIYDTATVVVAQSSLPPQQQSVFHHEIVDFERQEGVVIVTKLHSESHIGLLEQSLCLLHYAYNERMLYDIVIFSTLPILDPSIRQRVQDIVSPANVTFVVDNNGLQQEVNSLDEDRKRRLLRRCNVTSVNEMDWYMYCMEKSKGYTKSMERLAYTWQAEFRALHIWTHPAITKYSYMMWMDTDSFCTKVWTHDPIAHMIRHDYKILFDHFPMGYSDGDEFQDRFVRAFNRTLCRVQMNGDGTLRAVGGYDYPCRRTHVGQIHGFFHITDLKFYRSEPVMNWNRILIGKAKFSRRFDDQIAVTAPAAILAPNKSREMESAGLKLDVFHNYKLDGKEQVGGFIKWWSVNGKSSFPSAYGKCTVDHAG